MKKKTLKVGDLVFVGTSDGNGGWINTYGVIVEKKKNGEHLVSINQTIRVPEKDLTWANDEYHKDETCLACGHCRGN